VAASKAGPEALAPAAAVQEAAPGAEALFDPAAAGSRAWRLSLPGKDPLILRSLSPGAAAPKFGVKDALVYAGMTVIWRASEKADANTSFLLALSSPAGAQGRLLLDDDFLYLDGRRLRLPSAMALQKGAPVLDARGLSAVIAALGAFQPRWDAAGAAELAAAAQAAGTPQPGAPGGEASPSVASAPAQTPEGAPSPSSEPTAHVAARPLKGGKVRTIVIDAGHGGYDPGARGPYGTKEKDVCLRIAERLRDALNDKDPDLRVVLTRDSDTFVSLEDRTLIANQARGDLFVSIHNNASPSPRTHGTQVFFFDSQSSDKAAEDLTMRENGEANQLDVLMTDLAKSIVRDQSIQFATGIQNALGETLNLKHRDISYAPFYVLARTQMPAILVEVAFITNPREELLLRNGEFQGRVANSLADGVVQYAHLSESPR
jgi:N-acetylmuramoyl-L-alanine amidase